MSLSNVDVTAAIIIITATWFIVQSIKSTSLSNKLLPLVSIIVGVIVSIAYSYFIVKSSALGQDIFLGIISGFGASGLDDTFSDSISGIVNSVISGFSSNVENQASTETDSSDSVSSDTNTTK
ncbi:holin [Oenococcus oeni]